MGLGNTQATAQILGNTKGISHSWGTPQFNAPAAADLTPSKISLSGPQRLASAIVGLGKGVVQAPYQFGEDISHAIVGPVAPYQSAPKNQDTLLRQLNAQLKQGKISQRQYQLRVNDISGNSSGAAQLTNEIQNNQFNQRKAAGHAVGTAGAILASGELPGSGALLTRLAANTALGSTIGAGNALSEDKFSRGELLKQMAISGVLAGGATALGAGLTKLRGAQAAKAAELAANKDVASVDSIPYDQLANEGKIPVTHLGGSLTGTSEVVDQAAYNKAAKALNKNYELDMAGASAKGPLIRQAAMDAIDQKYQALQQKLDESLGSTKINFSPPAKTSAAKAGTSSSVVQVVNPKTGEKYYQTVAPEHFKTAQALIDTGPNGENGVAGSRINGEQYHLTAKTPAQMEAAGFKSAGQFEPKAFADATGQKLPTLYNPRNITQYSPSVAKTLNETSLSTSTKGSGVIAEGKNAFTPGGGAEGKAIANDLRATTGDLALQKNTQAIAAKSDVDYFAKKSVGDNLNFIQRIESGVKQPTPELQAKADKLAVAHEDQLKLAQTIDPNVVRVENYFPRPDFWANPKSEVDAVVNKFAKPTLGGKPSALEHRGIPTIYDGIKAGLVPKESNPALISLENDTQLRRAAAAQDFFNKQVEAGHSPQLVQAYIDRVMGKGMTGSDAYQRARQATFAINNLQLGFSGFHITGTAINAVVSQFANGLQDITHGNLGKGAVDIAKAPFAPLDYLFKGNQIVKDFKAGNITGDIKNIAEGGGRIGQQVDFRTTGLAKSLEQIQSGSAKEIAKGVAAAPLRAFSTAAKPVMEWWVPRIKAGATKELIDRKLSELGPNASAAAQRAAKAEAIDSIDNRFGQLVKDNLMWNKTLKDGLSIFTRSPGWNIGTVRELGGGVTDLFTKTARGGGLSERSAYTASLAATTMMIGTALSYMFTGKAPENPIDYFYPKTGQIDKNGNEERVSLPTYAKDIFAFTHNPGQTISNKANPLLSLSKQVLGNKDYFGNEVRNPEDSLATQAKQTLSFVGKNALPFSLTNSSQRVSKGPATKAQTFFGLNPAPSYITKSPFEQKVQAALNQSLGTKSLTPEDQALINAKSKAKQAFQSGDTSQIDALAKSGDITQKQADNLKAASGQSSLANQFQYLMKVDRPAAAKLIDQASPKDLQKLGNLTSVMQTLAQSSKNQNITSSKRSDAQKLLNKLNNTGQNTDQLIQQKKAATATKARATRAAKR